MIDKILMKVSKADLYQQISEELFERDYNEIEKQIKEYRRKKGEGL